MWPRPGQFGYCFPMAIVMDQRVGMESEWSPVKASEHQSALRDVLKWLGKRPSLSADANCSHLTTTWGVPAWKWKQHRAKHRAELERIRFQSSLEHLEADLLDSHLDLPSWVNQHIPFMISTNLGLFILISLKNSMSVLMFLPPFLQTKSSWSQSFLLEEQEDIFGFYRISKF